MVGVVGGEKEGRYRDGYIPPHLIEVAYLAVLKITDNCEEGGHISP